VYKLLALVMWVQSSVLTQPHYLPSSSLLSSHRRAQHAFRESEQ